MVWKKNIKAKRINDLKGKMEDARLKLIDEVMKTMKRMENVFNARANGQKQFDKIKEDLISGLVTKGHRDNTSA